MILLQYKTQYKDHEKVQVLKIKISLGLFWVGFPQK